MQPKGSLWAGISQARAGNFLADVSKAVETFVVQRGFQWCASIRATGWAAGCTKNRRCSTMCRRCGARTEAQIGYDARIRAHGGRWYVAHQGASDGWTVVTADGKRSAHFEHTIAVTDGEPEILTVL